MRSVWKYAGIMILFMSLLFIYGYFDPGSFSWYPRCIFLTLTGYRCPGCGLQRALHSVIHLDLCAAVRYNAFVLVSVPVILLYLFDHLASGRYRRLHRLLTGRLFIIAIVFVTLAWWIIRNLTDI